MTSNVLIQVPLTLRAPDAVLELTSEVPLGGVYFLVCFESRFGFESKEAVILSTLKRSFLLVGYIVRLQGHLSLEFPGACLDWAFE